jgi:hypothetical protein
MAVRSMLHVFSRQSSAYVTAAKVLQYGERLAVWSLRIPRQSCHRFHGNPATDSRTSPPLVPDESCHGCHAKAATDSRRRLPPLP